MTDETTVQLGMVGIGAIAVCYTAYVVSTHGDGVALGAATNAITALATGLILRSRSRGRT